MNTYNHLPKQPKSKDYEYLKHWEITAQITVLS